MAFRIQIRRDTSAKWEVNNTVLLEGEIGYTTDTKYMKIGDGDTAWNDLNYWNGPSTYKVYTALMTQTGTDAPTATVLENTLGGTVVWAYVSQGSYTATLTGAFTLNKTVIFNNATIGDTILTTVRNNTNAISVVSRGITGATLNGALQNTSIEIRVYN